MIISRVKEKKGFILYQRLRRGDTCPKYFIYDGIVNEYVGEYRRYSEALKAFEKITK